MIRKIALATVLSAPVVILLCNQSNDTPHVTPAARPVTHLAPTMPVGAASAPTLLQRAPADDETELVFGLRVRKDRDCRVELKDYVTPAGDMFSAYSCTPEPPSSQHKYADYDNQTLESMAYADADAAALLGQRLIDSDTGKSYELLIRAAALDGGNLDHIAWLADQAFGTVAVDGEPQIQNLQRRYELAALVARLNNDPEISDHLRNELIDLGITDSALARMDARVGELLESMQDIQRLVQGEVTLGGRGDA